jgi:hypothetical protein
MYFFNGYSFLGDSTEEIAEGKHGKYSYFFRNHITKDDINKVAKDTSSRLNVKDSIRTCDPPALKRDALPNFPK